MVVLTNGWVSDDMSSTNYFTDGEERQQMGTVYSGLDGVLLGGFVLRRLGQGFLLLLWGFDKLERRLVNLFELLGRWRSQAFVLKYQFSNLGGDLAPVYGVVGKLRGLGDSGVDETGGLGDDSGHDSYRWWRNAEMKNSPSDTKPSTNHDYVNRAPPKPQLSACTKSQLYLHAKPIRHHHRRQKRPSVDNVAAPRAHDLDPAGKICSSYRDKVAQVVLFNIYSQ